MAASYSSSSAARRRPGRDTARTSPARRARAAIADRLALACSPRSPPSSPGWRIQCAEYVGLGSKPRSSLCSPCAPASNSGSLLRDRALDARRSTRSRSAADRRARRRPSSGRRAPAVGLEEQRAGDALAAGDDLDHPHRVGQLLRERVEEPRAQVVAAAVVVGRVAIEPIEIVELRPASSSPPRPTSAASIAARAALALLAQLLALARS